MKPEAALHRTVAQYLRAALTPPTTWTTIAHGGGGRVRGAQLKAMGLVPGWPDILVMHPMADLNTPPDKWSTIVVGIELKSKVGRLEPEQRAVMAAFHDCAAWYILCRSVEEVAAALRHCKVPLRARAA